MALVSGIILGHQWVLLVGCAWLLVRLWYLKRPVVSVITLVVTCLFTLVCLTYQHQIETQRVKEPHEVTTSMRVYPDQVKVNGDQYQLVAQNLKSGNQLQVYGQINSLRQQQQIMHISQCATWTVKGSLEPISIATNVNQFDAQQYAATHRVYNQLVVDQITKIADEPSHGVRHWIDWCHELRYGLITYFDTMPKMVKLYCNSLLIGNPLRDFSTVMTGVQQLGLIHLFSISGMHVFLFVSMIRLVMVYLRMNKETINWLLVIILPVYLIIGGGSAGLIRATIMAEITLICQTKLFKLSKVDIWSLSLVGGLLYQPMLLLTLGGQLSYLLAFMLHFLPAKRPFLSAVLMNLIGLPSILYYIYEWHCLSLLASYLMIPFFAAVIFPAVIGCCLIFWIFPGGVSIVDQLLVLFQSAIDHIGALPGMIHFGKPPIVAVWVLFLLTLLVFIWPTKHSNWLLMLSSYVVVFTIIHFPLSGEVSFFDIGQGDSFLIREPLNKRVTMIDTGGQLSFAKAAWAQQVQPTSKAVRVSVNYLKSRGINHIDNLCLSHQDTDHIGFTGDILAHMKVDQISFPKGMEKQHNFKTKVLPLAQRQHTKLIPIVAGSTVPKLPLEVLHPFKVGKGANEDSVVLTGMVGGLRFIFMGDLDRNGEKQIMARYPDLTVDVLKLGHHGSKTASDPSFVKRIQPRLAVISAGRMNRYGHPNKETMKTLKKEKIASVSTQQYGMISYHYDLFGQTSWHTKLKGDELKWMLPPYSNS